MKNISLLLFFSLIMGACTTETAKEPTLLGKWQLVAILTDPGDGSGTFREVESEVTLSFFSDNTVTSNASLCQMGAETGSPDTATYNAETGEIYPDCNGIETFNFRIEGEYLFTGNYRCIEGCSQKYKKIK